ncbi:MAG: hypothetical protein GY929_25865 [Actinomycetia bacterium]|nr:hypothetical protein [Actinomycetes bacterium]
MTDPSPGRLRRLADQLDEDAPGALATAGSPDLVLAELDYAMRPTPHERRLPTYGAIVDPVVEPGAWEGPTTLHVARRPTEAYSDSDTRRFADGLASWVVRSPEGANELVVFDRPVGSERDLVVLAGASGATVVQRHPSGVVRVAGRFGVLRFEGLAWHHEPPLESWVDTISCGRNEMECGLFEDLLGFAVHDLGARGIGATLVFRPSSEPAREVETSQEAPPPLRVDSPADLAPLHHVLGQIDGAAFFDETGTLRQLGAKLLPSRNAEAVVDAFRGTRHTSALRYSFDDPSAMVVVVSEDGPVTVLRAGTVLGRSGTEAPQG